MSLFILAFQKTYVTLHKIKTEKKSRKKKSAYHTPQPPFVFRHSISIFLRIFTLRTAVFTKYYVMSTYCIEFIIIFNCKIISQVDAGLPSVSEGSRAGPQDLAPGLGRGVVLPLPSSVTLGKPLNLSRPQCPQL